MFMRDLRHEPGRYFLLLPTDLCGGPICRRLETQDGTENARPWLPTAANVLPALKTLMYDAADIACRERRRD